MADITPPLPRDRQLIQRYGGGGFRIAGRDYRGSVLVAPDRTTAWAVSGPSEIDMASLAPLFDNVPVSGAVLLVGTGATLAPPGADLRVALRRVGIGLDAMDTGAACRTFNVLLAEGRRVFAALVAVG